MNNVYSIALNFTKVNKQHLTFGAKYISMFHIFLYNCIIFSHLCAFKVCNKNLNVDIVFICRIALETDTLLVLFSIFTAYFVLIWKYKINKNKF